MNATLSTGAAADNESRALFVLGITHRSGTNLALNLLALHPECRIHTVPEDFLVAELGQLANYVDKVSSHWNPKWPVNEARHSIQQAIGDALQGCVSGAGCGTTRLPAPSAARIVATKTPSVSGLAEFRRFFPDALLVVVVRDGRAVVESGIRSFDWGFYAASRRWSDSAKAIAKFMEHDTNPDRTLLVRYEDLVEYRERSASLLFEFAGLNPDLVPDSALQELPVTGSSELVKSRQDKVHWQPMADSDKFNPTERFETWSRFRHARFNNIAREGMELLGYTIVPVSGYQDWLARLAGLGDFRHLEVRRSLRKLLKRSGR